MPEVIDGLSCHLCHVRMLWDYMSKLAPPVKAGNCSSAVAAALFCFCLLFYDMAMISSHLCHAKMIWNYKSELAQPDKTKICISTVATALAFALGSTVILKF